MAIFQRDRGPVTPPPENFIALKSRTRVELRWTKPHGVYEGYIIFAGHDPRHMNQLERVESPRQTSFIVTHPIDDEMYKVVTYRHSRVSTPVFASIAGQVAQEVATTERSEREQTPAQQTGVTEVIPAAEAARTRQPEEAERPDVCIGCEGTLELQEVERDSRKRKLLKCRDCGKEHVKNSSGRLFLTEQLNYGCCICPECDELHILVTGRGNRIVCSKTGLEHAVYKRGGKTEKIILARDLQFGFCSCCSPHMPLEFIDGRFHCYAKPDIEYVRIGTSENFRIRYPGEEVTDSIAEERRDLLGGTLDLGPMGLPVPRRGRRNGR